MRKRGRNTHIHGIGGNGSEAQRLTAPITTQERNEIMRALGSVVYAVRLPDNVIKIGCTTNLPARLSALGAEELLAFKPGSYDAEELIHESLVSHRHHGYEYYHPVPEVYAVVNEMRTALGMDPIAA
jgi:hypothetical protein